MVPLGLLIRLLITQFGVSAATDSFGIWGPADVEGAADTLDPRFFKIQSPHCSSSARLGFASEQLTLTYL